MTNLDYDEFWDGVDLDWKVWMFVYLKIDYNVHFTKTKKSVKCT
jgi:hypothetical protein